MAEYPSRSPQTEAGDQPLDSFLADAGLAFDDIPVAMAIHHRALAAARRAPLDVDLAAAIQSVGLPQQYVHRIMDELRRLSSIPTPEEPTDD